ncbi:solute carrier family 25 (mitochondrial aspartate/glutamate transporter), member 12/13 [Entomortierella parvispora]|uniref:Mitochondrial aspartate-glutamate transporter AGC1 n=1 Tax=Entomortierella parvispora TaxID=205924 RepID=A0A9P3H6L6_9FUNG|nr:solute carrier family 25 (mitochondrial aspartate/glutamate transporter), member 12/13 [Entomortierella parvispora]
MAVSSSPSQDQSTSPSTSKFVSKLGAGAVAGIVGVLIVYPLDMVKTRLQNQKKDALGRLQYKGGIDCFKQVIAKEGARGLYRGIVPNLVGITPEKAIKLAVNDFSREYWAARTNVSEDKLAIHYGMLSGATAGLCQVIATNPMEIVKIQMQVAGSQKLEAGAKRPTAMDIVRSLGLRGLYRGTPATLMRDVPFSIMFFPLNSYLKLKGADKDGKTSFSVILGAGLVAGVIAASAVTPADVIKTRLQVATKPGEPAFRGIADCFQHIVRNEGVAALFKGVVPRSLIVAPMFAIALFVYELQQRFLGPVSAEVGSTHTITSSPVLMLTERR